MTIGDIIQYEGSTGEVLDVRNGYALVRWLTGPQAGRTGWVEIT